MKNVNAATSQENTATFYIDECGDIFDCRDDAGLLGLAGTVVVDGMFVGSLDDMRSSALRKYNAA